MLRVAFASTDRLRVNQHFGAAEGFVVYDIGPESHAMVAIGAFPEESMDGNETKLVAKVDFLAGCAAVYVQAIGASAIKQLVAKGIQPIRVTETDAIADLIREVAEAIRQGGVPWVDRAVAQHQKAAAATGRFDRMEEEGWEEA
jgi:nitrogen fixation protein NifX